MFSGRLVKVRRERWQFNDLPPVEREIVWHPGSVVVAPLIDREHLILIRQFRVTIQRHLWELPAGTREVGEPLRCCALRELIEETGYRSRRMKRIAEFLPSPGFCAETMHLFLAWDLVAGDRQQADDEPISTHVVPFAKALTMIEQGNIIDAKTMIGIMLAYRFCGALPI